jgi:sugar lactone lactonase YvrE
MRRLAVFLCILLLMSPLSAAPLPVTAQEALIEVDTLGILPDDYVGTLTLESVNTVELDFPVEYAYPSQGIAVLPSGDIAVCDTSYGRIHVMTAGLSHLRTIGALGSGRGELQYPADVATDEAGNLYVADFLGNKLVMFAPDGSTVFETGTEGEGQGQFQGAAGVAVTSDGIIWVADHVNDRVQQFDRSGAFIRSLTGINRPTGLTATGLTVYVVGSLDSTVYRLSGTKVTQLFAVPGDGEDVVTSAADIAVDAEGLLYIADRGTGELAAPAIKVYTQSGSYERSYGQYPEDMSAIQESELLTPGGVAVAKDGSVYVMNSGFFRDATNPFGGGFGAKLVRYATQGGVLTAQSFDVGTRGRLNDPQDVAIDSRGQAWVACSVPELTASGTRIAWSRGYVSVLDGSGNNRLTLTHAGSRTMQVVLSVAANGKGQVFVGAADAAGSFLAVFDEDGTFQRTIAAGIADVPRDLEVADDGTLWMCNQEDGSVVHVNSTGTELGRFMTPGSPAGLSLLPGGDLLVCVWGKDSEVQQVVRYGPDGAVKRTFGLAGGGRGTGQFYYPHDAVLTPDGLVLVSDAENGRFTAFRQDGTVAWTTARSWYLPGRMTWSPDGLLYVTDGMHNVVRVLRYGSSVASPTAPVTARFDSVAREVAPGAAALFTLSLRNAGTRLDTISLDATGTDGWGVLIQPASIQIPAGETRLATVRVQSPAGALVGANYACRVTVRSTVNPAGTFTVSADTTVQGVQPVIVGGTSLKAFIGEEFAVPLAVRGAVSLVGIGCDVEYDHTLLDLVRVEAGSLMGAGALFAENRGTIAGKVSVGLVSAWDAPPVTGDGTLAIFTFRSSKQVSSQVSLQNLVCIGASGAGTPIPGIARAVAVDVGARPPEPVRIVLVLQIGSKVMRLAGGSVPLDVAPIIVEQRTLVPMRAIVEALGGVITWDPVLRRVTVRLEDHMVAMDIGSPAAQVDGKSVAIDPANPAVVPLIMGGRTMLPLRFVGESLGADIQWNAGQQTVTITWPKP